MPPALMELSLTVAPTVYPSLMPVLFRVEQLRKTVNARLDPRTRVRLGQFMTPLPVAQFMAGLLPAPSREVRLLDAGAGIGSLTAAAAAHLLEHASGPLRLHCTSFEVDGAMAEGLGQTFAWLQEAAGPLLLTALRAENFLTAPDLEEAGPLLPGGPPRFTHVILNPPYRKITGRTPEKALLTQRGLDTTNLYTAFLDLAVRLLEPGGELVAITPRSFFNGVYYREFRQRFLREMTLRRIHLIDSRREAFQDDGVLQETVIFRATKGGPKGSTVEVSSSMGFGPDEELLVREVPYALIVREDDPQAFIRVDTDEHAARLSGRSDQLGATLADLGLRASTGKVVDFRALHLIGRSEVGEGQPLIYPGHLRGGQVQWPVPLFGKPNVVRNVPGVGRLLVPEGYYVLIKRFSAKEESRRVSAAVYEPERARPGDVGFENHLNYIHEEGRGLSRPLALGLCAFMNSTAFDVAFRQFSGHTQVNVTDLKTMRFPDRATLQRLGERLSLPLPDQETLDALVQAEVFGMNTVDPRAPIQARIAQAKALLEHFDLPRSAQNDRSALTLLALLDLKPEEPWSEARQPLRGVTPIMAFCEEHYGRHYQPNSRESFRKETLHHWVSAALAQINPDDPARPTNSQKTVYRVHDDFLALARLYDTPAFAAALQAYAGGAARRWEEKAAVRAEHLLTVRYGDDEFTLSPGGQNPLVRDILDLFCPEFAPGAELIYVGDTADKNATRYGLFRKERLAELGVTLGEHGKMPDVIVYRPDKNWLYLIEAVSGHGPFDHTRLEAMRRLFAHSTAGLVYVTAFPDRKRLQKYVGVIAWETEVWVAEAPRHLIHFNGDRFLGPRGG